MQKWLGVEFKSGTKTTPQFSKFSTAFKKEITKRLPEGASLIRWSKGHFYLSGFIYKEKCFVYFSISDVRSFKDEWYNDILVRTAKSDKDFSGGQNHYTTLKDFEVSVYELLETQRRGE